MAQANPMGISGENLNKEMFQHLENNKELSNS